MFPASRALRPRAACVAPPAPRASRPPRRVRCATPYASRSRSRALRPGPVAPCPRLCVPPLRQSLSGAPGL